MSTSIISKLEPIELTIDEFPLSKEGERTVEQGREDVKRIIAGEDSRFLVIVGPCSAWPAPAVLEYAARLKELVPKVEDALKVVMRVYIQKPRTTKGWTGPINQPDPLGSPDIHEGIRYCRKMMTEVISMGLPIADEALYTSNAKGFIELISWLAVGARSSEDQEHRIFASAVDCPVGMKNPTAGSIEIGVNGIIAAQHSHRAVFDGYEVQTSGNPYAHLVLRGGLDGSNYSIADLDEASFHLEKSGVQHPAVIIDASHDNSKIDGVKHHKGQLHAVRTVLEHLKERPDLEKMVKGFMLESFIKEGSQKVDPAHPEKLDMGGCSITDPCLSFEQTEDLLLELATFKRT